MIPLAYVAHRLPGRVRLRIPSHRGERDYFARTGERLQDCPGVEWLRTDFRTGSILIQHAPELDIFRIARFAEDAELFRVGESWDRGTTMLRGASAQLAGLNAWLQEFSRGRADLSSLLFALLIGLAIVQIFRGKILGSATAFLWYALYIARRGGESADT